jgi:hypothetical protein
VVVSPAVPHPFGETAARGLYVLVTGLLERGIQVKCLVATTETESRVREARATLGAVNGGSHLQLDVFPLTVRPVALRKWRSLWRPFSETRYAHGLAEALARHEASGYDVLHLEQLWSGWLGLGRARALLNVYQLEIVDWEGRRLSGWGERKALMQMKRATTRLLRGARQVQPVDKWIVSLGPLLFENGVHADLLLMGEDVRHPQLVNDEEQHDDTGGDQCLADAAHHEPDPVAAVHYAVAPGPGQGVGRVTIVSGFPEPRLGHRHPAFA